MNATMKALAELAEIRESYRDPESAYVARTRLKRAILSVMRAVAEECGADGPDVPGPYKAPGGASAGARAIVARCNLVLAASTGLCQPSEALDARWRSGWDEVMRELVALETVFAGSGLGVDEDPVCSFRV